jgi:hypothetical protein
MIDSEIYRAEKKMKKYYCKPGGIHIRFDGDCTENSNGFEDFDFDKSEAIHSKYESYVQSLKETREEVLKLLSSSKQ